MAEWGKLSKDEQRLQIARDTEEFLAKGYQITRLPMDCSVLEGRLDDNITATRDFNYEVKHRARRGPSIRIGRPAYRIS